MAPSAVLSHVDMELAVEIITARYAKECATYHSQRLEAEKSGEPLPPPPRILVGMAGRPGSGKTTALAAIAERLQGDLHRLYVQQRQHPGQPVRTNAGEVMPLIPVPPHCVCMPMDGYHLYRRELQAMKNPAYAFERRGAEWTFNPEKLAKDLKLLKEVDPETAHTKTPAYRAVRVPSFNHGVGDPVERDILVPATASVILVEGNYVLYTEKPAWKAVVDQWDVKIFLHAQRSVCTERLCRRHMKAWNVPREKAMIRAMGSDTKNGDLVDTTRREADIVIRSVQLDILGKL